MKLIWFMNHGNFISLNFLPNWKGDLESSNLGGSKGNGLFLWNRSCFNGNIQQNLENWSEFN